MATQYTRWWNTRLPGYDNVRDRFQERDEGRKRLVVRTQYGLVYVAMVWFYDDASLDFAEFEIVVDRRVITSHVAGRYSDRYLVTLAKRFAHDAVCSEVPFGCEPEGDESEAA